MAKKNRSASRSRKVSTHTLQEVRTFLKQIDESVIGLLADLAPHGETMHTALQGVASIAEASFCIRGWLPGSTDEKTVES